MNKLNSQVVELLEGELGFVLGEAERMAETFDPQHPVAFVQLITQIKGTCAMVGLDSLRHLADELARTLTKESLAKVVDPQQLKELVHQSLVSARKLARAVIDTRTDNVCALLPEMTALRRLRGEPPLYEYHCLTQVNWPALDSAVATNPLGGEQQDDVRRLLHLYQFGLLDVIRDNNRNKAFVILFRVCKRIEDIAVLEAEKNYWWIVSLVIHVEAGLRSFDRGMPEEINRVLTDQLSDVLFTTEPDGERNLLREGISADRIHFVGNVMIDTLMSNIEKAVPAAETLRQIASDGQLRTVPERFGVLTLHRPSNVDDADVLHRLLSTINELSEGLPLVFPLHPRTRSRIIAGGLENVLKAPNIAAIPPLGYLQLLGLMRSASVVLTDSGGIQEETTALGVPCITLRENTERPVTVSDGTNTIVGADPSRIREAFEDVLRTGGKAGRVPQLWDGKAAERIADVIEAWAMQRQAAAA